MALGPEFELKLQRCFCDAVTDAFESAIWARVQDRMEERGITQEDLAARLNVKQPTVSRWISCKTSCSLQRLLLVLAMLDLDFKAIAPEWDDCLVGGFIAAMSYARQTLDPSFCGYISRSDWEYWSALSTELEAWCVARTNGDRSSLDRIAARASQKANHRLGITDTSAMRPVTYFEQLLSDWGESWRYCSEAIPRS